MDYSDLVERYRVRVAEAKAKYEQAVAHTKSLAAGVSHHDLPSPEASQALRDALVVERAALDAYKSVRLDLLKLILQTPPRSFHA